MPSNLFVINYEGIFSNKYRFEESSQGMLEFMRGGDSKSEEIPKERSKGKTLLLYY